MYGNKKEKVGFFTGSQVSSPGFTSGYPNKHKGYSRFGKCVFAVFPAFFVLCRPPVPEAVNLQGVSVLFTDGKSLSRLIVFLCVLPGSSYRQRGKSGHKEAHYCGVYGFVKTRCGRLLFASGACSLCFITCSLCRIKSGHSPERNAKAEFSHNVFHRIFPNGPKRSGVLRKTVKVVDKQG